MKMILRLILSSFAALSLNVTLLAQPTNDDFADRTVLSGTNLTINASNASATSEPSEPDHGFFTNSVWWEWTAPEAGTLRVSVSAGGFQPALMIYNLWDTNLYLLELSTRNPVGVTMLAGSNSHYVFVVGGLDGGSGDFQLSLRWSGLPPNAEFADAIHLGSGDGQTNGCILPSYGPSAWYSWTATKDGPVTFSIPERWFTLDVYSGNSEPDLQLLASSQGRVEIEGTQATTESVAGITYYVRVGTVGANDFTLNINLNRPPLVGLRRMPGSSPFLGQVSTCQAEVYDSDGRVVRVDFFNRISGFDGYIYFPIDTDAAWPFQLAWTNRPNEPVALVAVASDDQGARTISPVSLLFPSVPYNDPFTNRIEFIGSFLNVTGWCAGAGIEPSEIVPDHANGGSVWFTWTAPFSGPATMQAGVPGWGDNACRYYTIGVYTGSDLPSLTGVTNGLSPLSFVVSSGTVYQVAVYGYEYHTNFPFVIAESTPPTVQLTSPAAGTRCVSGSQIPVSADVIDEGSVEKVDFYLDSNLIGSVTNPPYTLLYTVPEKEYITQAVLRAIAFDDHRLGGLSGDARVDFVPRPPSNDAFTNALALTGTALNVTVDLRNATAEPNESNWDRSVWYSWTAPFSRVVTLKLDSGSASIGVFTGSALGSLILIGGGSPDLRTGDPARVTFAAVAGVEYKIRVAGGGLFDSPSLELVPSAPPAVTLTSPAPHPLQDQYLSGTPVLFSANATDGDGSIQRVNFYADGYLVGTAYDLPYQCIAFFTNEYGTAYHSAWALAIDSDGLDQRSEETFFRVYATPPENDLFANRIVLNGPFLSIPGTTASARTEPGEYVPPEPEPGSVWWSWQAAASEPITIALGADGYGATLSIYTGTSISNLTLVANVGTSGDSRLPQSVTFPAVTGEQYQLAVRYSQDYGGPVSLVIGQSLPPVVSITTPTNDALFTSSEPILLSAEATAPGGDVREVSFYQEDTGIVLALATNAPWSTTIFLTNNGETGPEWGSVRLSARVTDNHGLIGYSEPRSFTVLPRRPPNDAFDNRFVVESRCSLSVTGSTVNATGDGGVGGYQPSVWWSWTAPQDGWITLDAEAAHDGYVGVFSGTGLTNLALVTSTNLGYYSSARLGFLASSGTAYAIEIATSLSYGGRAVSWNLYCEPPSTVSIASPAEGERFSPGTGVVVSVQAETPGEPPPVVEIYVDSLLVQTVTNPPYLASLAAPGLGYHSVQARAIGQYGLGTWSSEVSFGIFAPPVNDMFANRLPVSGFLASMPANSEQATREPGEPDPFGEPNYGTLWYTWTAPGSGTLKLQSADKWPSPFLSIWVGSSLSQLQLVATNETGISELVTPVTRGTTYQICCTLSRRPLGLFLDTADDPTFTRGGFTADGLYQLEIETLLQQPWVIEATSDFEQWIPLSTNSTRLNVFDFVDPESTVHQKRFYRVIPQQQ